MLPLGDRKSQHPLPTELYTKCVCECVCDGAYSVFKKHTYIDENNDILLIGARHCNYNLSSGFMLPLL